MQDALPAELAQGLQVAEMLAFRALRGEDAEDAAQEARLAVWRAWGRYDRARGAKFLTYAWIVARGAVRRFINQGTDARGRKRARYRWKKWEVPAYLLPPLPLDAPAETALESWRPETLADPAPLPEEMLLQQERVREVLAAIRPDFAAVLWQRYGEGLTATEVAARAGCSLSRACSLETRGKAAFVKAWEAAGV